MRIPIKNDLYDIADRIRKIDEKYEIIFNTENQKFEVLKNGALAVILPYENLDTRALDYVYYTRWDNAEKVLEDIERSNEELNNIKIKRAMDDLENGVSEAFRRLGI